MQSDQALWPSGSVRLEIYGLLVGDQLMALFCVPEQDFLSFV